jgi:protein-L-isoaspartate(D-aspartate) O-methyltransferase
LQAIARAAATPGVTMVTGPLQAGWPAQAPYDIILVEGAVDVFPEAYGAQLAAGTGRLVGVLRTGSTAQAVLGEAFGGQLAVSPVFDCATKLFPAFRRSPGFVF